MKILVTGANGFVGTHLCQKLLAQGHTVFGLVRNPKKSNLSAPNFIIIQGDLSIGNFHWVDVLPADLDACIHTAGLVHTYDVDNFYSVNALGTQYLIDSLKEKFPNKLKFILVSSLAASGPVNFGEIKDETDLDFPVSDYGRSKKEGEQILKSLAPKEWISSIVRPPMIIGPGDTAVLDIFKMVKNRFVLLPGSNSKKKEYSFVCIYDLIETISRLLASDLSITVYSAHESVIKFEELIEEIKMQLKIRWIIYLPLPLFIIKIFGFILNILYKLFPHQLRLTPDKINELGAKAWTCSSDLSKRSLHQVYQYDLKRTIDVTIKDYRHRQWL